MEGRAVLTIPGVGDVCLVSVPASSLPEDDGWLTAAEATILGRFRFSKRASDWRLGRWVAKEAVAEALRAWSAGTTSGAAEAGPPRTSERTPGPAEIEILAGPGGGPRSRILAPGEWPGVTVSLSHAGGVGFAAAAEGALRLGCDVEDIAPRSEAFVEDYLTDVEAAWVRAGGAETDARANLVWSAKESALKALGEGLRKDTRSVVVQVGDLPASPGAGGWFPLRVAVEGGRVFFGMARRDDPRVWTVVGSLDGGSR